MGRPFVVGGLLPSSLPAFQARNESTSLGEGGLGVLLRSWAGVWRGAGEPCSPLREGGGSCDTPVRRPPEGIGLLRPVTGCKELKVIKEDLIAFKVHLCYTDIMHTNVPQEGGRAGGTVLFSAEDC